MSRQQSQVAPLLHVAGRASHAVALIAGLALVYSVQEMSEIFTEWLSDNQTPDQIVATLLDLHLSRLSSSEADLLLGLSVFSGSTPLPTVAEVLGDTDAPGHASTLHRRGLLLLSTDSVTLPIFLRPLLKQKLDVGVRARHQRALDAYLQDLIHRATPYLYQTSDPRWLDRLDAEADNLLPFLSRPRPQTLALLTALWRWWIHRRPAFEGIDLLHANLQTDGYHPLDLQIEAFRALGVFWHRSGCSTTAAHYLRRSIVGGINVQRLDIVAEAFLYLGNTHRDQKDFEQADYCHRITQRLAIQQNNRWLEAASNNGLGITALTTSNLSAAEKHFSMAGALYILLNDHTQAAKVLNNLAVIAEAQSDHASALYGFQRALESARQSNDPVTIAQTLHNLGSSYSNIQEWKYAEPFLRESIAIMGRSGYFKSIALAVSNLAIVLAEEDRKTHALALFGASEVLRETYGSYWPTQHQEERQSVLARLHESLRPAVYTRFYRAGRAMDLQQLLDFMTTES